MFQCHIYVYIYKSSIQFYTRRPKSRDIFNKTIYGWSLDPKCIQDQFKRSKNSLFSSSMNTHTHENEALNYLSTKYIAYSFYETGTVFFFIKKHNFDFTASYSDSVLNHLNAHLLHFLTDICIKECVKCQCFFVYKMKVNGVQCCSAVMLLYNNKNRKNL